MFMLKCIHIMLIAYCTASRTAMRNPHEMHCVMSLAYGANTGELGR